MSKSLIGWILTLIGFIIIVATIYMNQSTSIFDVDASQVNYLLVVIGGFLVLIGIFILSKRFDLWAGR
jgi:hypothetical protein